MSQETPPSWYSDGNVRKTVRNAVSAGVDTEEIATILCVHTFDDVPLTRVESIVEAIPADTGGETSADLPLSQSPSTDSEPRENPVKQFSVGDLGYLSNREAARVVGLALEQFDGNTVRAPANAAVETDLVWNRQHMSVAVRVEPTVADPVESNSVTALLDGKTVPDDVRSPSELAIVTNTKFTDDALETADEHDVLCFDAGHVEEWFRRARIPSDAVGTLLEEGENHDGPLADLVDIPPMPAPRKTVDPLQIPRAFDIEAVQVAEDPEASDDDPTGTSGSGERTPGTELDRTPEQDGPLDSNQPAAGKKGTLYADPDEDGDYDAFDDYMDDL